MKTLLIVNDGEGLPGVKTWSDICADFYTDKPTKKLQTVAISTINTAIKAAKEAGYTKIIVLDWHASANNFPRNRINGTVYPGHAPFFKKALKGADAAILLGMNGKYGTKDGNPPMNGQVFKKRKPNGLAHTWAFSIKDLKINNISVGESILLHKMFAEQNVPIKFVLGTPSAISEVKGYDKSIITLENKKCTPTTLKKKIVKALKFDNKIKQPKFKSLSIHLKKHKDKNTDDTRILAHANAFKRMKSK